jgi:hypothetical protein
MTRSSGARTIAAKRALLYTIVPAAEINSAPSFIVSTSWR